MANYLDNYNRCSIPTSKAQADRRASPKEIRPHTANQMKGDSS